ncbi:TetR/AcrR family transcriptional regulator [Nocardia yunnanensis]|uniref:TetR/AcrR family transcriptional regulator n=1 Tax=Nocardia yunnanensis TaxID=2382165 RepID=A0A386ZE76_9NOCA|nr:TetR family transcriptional regulator [Nocardia yunnanensis]AYF76182.1 TetR/AcrR family transcriptional regulator [Nocardia yunnanensis]
MTRSGRRPGNSGTREAILDAARVRFAEVGFDKASIRSIATAASVDPALVHHYFGTKHELFAAALKLPVDPRDILSHFATVPVEDLGETIIRTVVTLWDSEIGVPTIAAFRTLLASDDPALARTFLLDIVLAAIRPRVDSPPGTGAKRAALAASQLAGLLVTRKILRIDPIASMPVEELAATVGPTLQRYFTGELPLTD